MKSILSMFLAVGLCACASAASVDWSVASKSFKTSDGSAERASGYYVAVFLYSDYSAVISGLAAGEGADVSAALSSYVQAYGTTKATGATGGTFTTTQSVGTQLTLFTVAFDAASIAAAQNYLVSTTSISDAYEAPATPTNVGEFKAASFSGSSWSKMEAVPEPSTAALALAGLALLLKRRKA